MPVYAVIRQTDPDDVLDDAVRNTFPLTSYGLGNGVWLVAATGTAQQISDRLEITPNGIKGTGTAIVIEAASYYGRANPAVWTWIKNNWEGGPHG